jgi:hypothetical protein
MASSVFPVKWAICWSEKPGDLALATIQDSCGASGPNSVGEVSRKPSTVTGAEAMITVDFLVLCGLIPIYGRKRR